MELAMRYLFGIFCFLYSAMISAESIVPVKTASSQGSIASSLQKEHSKLEQFHVPLLTIKGAIGPAISDYLVREINIANMQANHKKGEVHV